jgi:hypothetical protein
MDLQPLTPETWRSRAAAADVVLIGEHHDSTRDHDLQVEILQQLALEGRRDGRRLSVGVEMVQKRFQPVLDAYVAGRLDERGLYDGVEWATRWTWPFERYKPVFQFCQEQRIPLVALNTDGEVLSKVERGGLEALSDADWNANVLDRQGFAKLGADPAFKAYLSQVILPSYRMHGAMGILRQTVTGQVLPEDMTLKAFVRTDPLGPDNGEQRGERRAQQGRNRAGTTRRACRERSREIPLRAPGAYTAHQLCGRC